MRIQFINGSPNKQGNTASLASELLRGKPYDILNRTDLTIGVYGQSLPGDGLDTVIAAMEGADTIVIGSPVFCTISAAASAMCWTGSTAGWKRARWPGAGCSSCSRARARKSGCWRPANTP